MITHYFELRAIPQVDMTEMETVGYLIEQIHRNLYPFKGKIGLSFPLYGHAKTLGGIIRLFGTEADLTSLRNAIVAVIGDYAVFTAVKQVPEKVSYATFQRSRPVEQSDINRAKRRWAAQGLSENEITQRMNQWLDKPTRTYPHLFLKSRSTQQRMVLHIRRVETVKARTGTFSNYGLSTEATVPIF